MDEKELEKLVEKQRQESYLYPNVYEEISYHGSFADLQGTITETICKIPSHKIIEFARDECIYVSITGGMCLNVESFNGPTTKYLIIISEEIHHEDIQSTIAHEIAHGWLGHKIGSEVNNPESLENDARKLAKEWGFSGHGAGD